MSPLRSTAITTHSSLLRVTPPLRPASALSSMWDLHLGFSLNIGTSGSQVPYKSLHPGHATFMPVAAGKRVPFRLLPETLQPSGFDNVCLLSDTSSVVHSRSSPGCPPHMISGHAFSLTLTTMTLNHSNLRLFGTYALTSIPRGLPSSLAQHEPLLRFFLAHCNPADC